MSFLKERNDKLVKRTTSILVPADAEGITIEPIVDDYQEIGRGQFSRVHFDDVEISPENIIGKGDLTCFFLIKAVGKFLIFFPRFRNRL